MKFRRWCCGVIGLTCLLIAQAQAQAQANSDTVVNVDNGLRVSSGDGANSLLVGGYVMFDAIPLDSNDVRPPRFDLFNAWVFFVGRVARDFDYKIQYALDDGSGNKIRDAYIGFRINEQSSIRLGHFDVPTYAEHVSSLTYTTLAGRSMLDNLTLGRDVGVALFGGLDGGRWHYAMGMFNGNGIDANGEDNGAKDLALRFTGRLAGESDTAAFRLYPDISLSGGQQNGDSLRLKNEAGTVFLAATALPVEQAYRAAAGLYSMYKSLGVRVEYLANRYVFSTGGGTATADGLSVLVAYYLSGESDQYRDGLWQKTSPVRVFAHDGGAWQIAARFSRLRASLAMLRQITLAADKNKVEAADAATAATIGINWLPRPNARIGVSLIHTRFERLTGSPLRRYENTAIARATLQFF